MKERQPLLRGEKLTKRFGGLTAVDQVSLEVVPGEVVALLGDNGAGKSTFIGLISGVYQPDEGRIFFQDRAVTISSPLVARRLGIETIYQDLALCENLDAGANIFLGREPQRRRFGFVNVIDRDHMRREARNVLEQLDIRIPDAHAPVRHLSGGQRQAIAIARAVYWNARVLIMDEPTAALGVPEQRRVLELIRTLRERGVALLLISHHLQDVFAVADSVMVMRRGRNVGERPVHETSESEIVSLMIGAEELQGRSLYGNDRRS